MTFFRNIHYACENRRMWDESFNKVFIELFDFDPAPFYPALYFDIGRKTEEMRAMFMSCRTFMLEHGFFKAIADFTKAHGLASVGYVAAAKTIGAPWLFGDGMNYQRLSGAVGTELAHAYTYGMNGLKLASSAAYNYDKEQVICDIFGDYAPLGKDTVIRESMNAYARGVNTLMPRIFKLSGNGFNDSVSDEMKKALPEFNEFAARAQTLLRGGRHICDVAVLYPIFSLQCQTSLFESPSLSSFEYPTTPANADFMNIINMLMNYCFRDVTVLHPITLNKRCYIEDGILYLCNDNNHE
ncbi:MAG: hypothetical protein IJB11_04225, partial [Oscillospiraceae bacterium]|nr:hypothetical protein [Oscillospiraceae bacterium]